MKSNPILVSLVLIILIGCSHNEEIVQPKNEIESVAVKNGRLSFPNQQTLQVYLNDLINTENDGAAKNMEQYYNEGFLSLRPLVHESNYQREILRHLNEYRIKDSQFRTTSDSDLLEDFDDLEDVFGEEVFASFLNQDAELLIGDDVYKYTDTGLFIVNEDRYAVLDNLLESKSISKDILVPTETNTRNSFIEENNACGGLVTINDDVDYFIAPVESTEINEITDCDTYSGGTSGNTSSGGSSGTSSGTISNDEDLNDIINSLSECSGNSPWFANVFGTTKVCKANYASGKRVKIKYYNINAFIFWGIGFKVKHQGTNWLGLWRQTNASEMRMGINSITWKFPQIVPNNVRSGPTNIWFYDNQLYQNTGQLFDDLYIGQIPIPDIPFKNAFQFDAFVEFVIDFPVGNISSEEDLSQHFYEQIYSVVTRIARQNSKGEINRVVAVVAGLDALYVQYYDFSAKCQSCSKMERVFDWGVVFPEFTYSFGADYGAGVKITPPWQTNLNIASPSAVYLNSYGMAKIGSSWKGKRLVFGSNN